MMTRISTGWSYVMLKQGYNIKKYKDPLLEEIYTEKKGQTWSKMFWKKILEAEHLYKQANLLIKYKLKDKI